MVVLCNLKSDLKLKWVITVLNGERWPTVASKIEWTKSHIIRLTTLGIEKNRIQTTSYEQVKSNAKDDVTWHWKHLVILLNDELLLTGILLISSYSFCIKIASTELNIFNIFDLSIKIF